MGSYFLKYMRVEYWIKAQHNLLILHEKKTILQKILYLNISVFLFVCSIASEFGVVSFMSIDYLLPIGNTRRKEFSYSHFNSKNIHSFKSTRNRNRKMQWRQFMINENLLIKYLKSCWFFVFLQFQIIINTHALIISVNKD